MKNTYFVIVVMIAMITVSSFAQESSGEKNVSPYLGKKVLFVEGFIEKPFALTTLADKLKEVLDPAPSTFP